MDENAEKLANDVTALLMENGCTINKPAMYELANVTAISIGNKNRIFTYTDIEAEFILALIKAQQTALIERIERELRLTDQDGELHVSHVCPRDSIECAKFSQRCLTRNWQVKVINQIKEEHEAILKELPSRKAYGSKKSRLC